MNSLSSAPWALPLSAAASARLPGIESGTLAGRPFRVALPPGYAKRRRERYPLLVLLAAADVFGSVVEMTRLLAGSREVRGCIVADVGGPAVPDADELDAIVAECGRRWRVDAHEIAVFGEGDVATWLARTFGSGLAGVTRCILATATPDASLAASLPATRAPAVAWTTTGAATAAPVRWKGLPEAVAASLAVPAVLHGVRCFWARDHRYGDEVVPLARPLAQRALTLLAPVLRPLTKRPAFPAQAGNPHVVRSHILGRDFEVFVALPPGAAAARQRRYPTVIALDANAGFATVAETAARLARAGEIADCIVVGIGTPRTEGDLEFAFRRFEELSPAPAAEYRHDDALGRFFGSLFALRGENARSRLGKAAEFHGFIARELLPLLSGALPIDPSALTLLGHSAAGTFVGYALAQHESPFSGFVCLSPGVAISGHWMLRNARMPAAARLYTAVGGEEFDNRFNRIAGIPQTAEYVDALRRSGAAVPGCEVLEGESHTSVYPRAVARGLRVVLGNGRTS